jgi:hypothetical protein
MAPIPSNQLPLRFPPLPGRALISTFGGTIGKGEKRSWRAIGKDGVTTTANRKSKAPYPGEACAGLRHQSFPRRPERQWRAFPGAPCVGGARCECQPVVGVRQLAPGGLGGYASLPPFPARRVLVRCDLGAFSALGAWALGLRC